MNRGPRAAFAEERSLVDERLGSRVEPREAEGEPRVVALAGGLETDDAPFAAEEGITRGEGDLEAQHDTLRARLGADQGDGGAGEGVELVVEELVLGAEGARDADGYRGSRVVGHGREDSGEGEGEAKNLGFGRQRARARMRAQA